MNPSIVPLVCPHCGNSNNVIEREYKLGAEFTCDVCGTTSVMVMNQQLYAPRAGDLICVVCGRVAPASSRYCQCGADLLRKCINCLQEFPVYHQVCDHCGWPQDVSPQSKEGYVLNIQRLIKFMTDPDEQIRQNAHRQLSGIAYPSAVLVSTLLAAIEHFQKHTLVQRTCAELLSRIEPVPTEELLQALDCVQDDESLEILCRALSRTQELHDRIQPRLLELLKSSPVRWAAYETLQRIGTPKNILTEILLEILNSNNDGTVRSKACEYLGQPGNDTAIPLLMETVREDNQARIAAITALIHTGVPARDLIDTLVSAYEKDSNDQERRNIIEALGKLGAPAVPVLIFLIDREDNPEMERAACHALADIGEPALPALINVLKYKQDDPDVHVSACFTLGLMKEKAASAVPVLINLLEKTDAEPDRQLVYCYTLGQLGAPKAVPSLIRVMKRYEKLAPDYLNVWEAARKALIEIGIEAVPALRDLSKNPFQSSIERDAARIAIDIIYQRL